MDSNNIFEEVRVEYFFKMSQSRRLRRQMAKQLKVLKFWKSMKEEFPPYNEPHNLGIRKLKREITGNPKKRSSKDNEGIKLFKKTAHRLLDK